MGYWLAVTPFRMPTLGDGALASVQHKEFLDLQAPLLAIVERIVDLAEVTKKYYYHPDMQGSWSLKYIGPSVASSINYKELGEVVVVQ